MMAGRRIGRAPPPGWARLLLAAVLGGRIGQGTGVATKADFMALYQQLGLAPGCSLDELKTAYRRRVAELHPDRHGAAATDATALSELTVAYNAASVFHRRYGRLPGAAHPAPAPPQPRAQPAEWASAGHEPWEPRRVRRWPWLLLAMALAWGLWASGMFDADPRGDADTAPPDAAADLPARAAPPASGLIVLGSDIATVRALQGRPLMEGAGRWDYGPSWIVFSDGKVVDWYSSPLRPLKVASAHPAPPRPAH